MSFIWPVMLILLLAVPLFVLLYLRMQRRRKRLAASYGSMGMTLVSGRELGWRRHIPIALFLIGLTILLVALARPQAVINLPRIEGIVMLTFDVSGSMAADDLKPTRMEAAKEAARQFVLSQPPTVQIGVVSFSDSGFTVQVPTNEQEVILATIDRLKPERGTSLGNGILVSLEAIAAAQAGDTSSYYTNLTLTPAPTPTPMPRGTLHLGGDCAAHRWREHHLARSDGGGAGGCRSRGAHPHGWHRQCRRIDPEHRGVFHPLAT